MYLIWKILSALEHRLAIINSTPLGRYSFGICEVIVILLVAYRIYKSGKQNKHLAMIEVCCAIGILLTITRIAILNALGAVLIIIVIIACIRIVIKDHKQTVKTRLHLIKDQDEITNNPAVHDRLHQLLKEHHGHITLNLKDMDKIINETRDKSK